MTMTMTMKKITQINKVAWGDAAEENATQASPTCNTPATHGRRKALEKVQRNSGKSQEKPGQLRGSEGPLKAALAQCIQSGVDAADHDVLEPPLELGAGGAGILVDAREPALPLLGLWLRGRRRVHGRRRGAKPRRGDGVERLTGFVARHDGAVERASAQILAVTEHQ
eukprot:m.123720 g.123720  ORF g.123720 m.123720 type:complete len:168 (-) comp9334_c1_seq1:240-743(-)